MRQKLHDIEKKEGIEILYAAESGSRAWGFESVDSDFDVRFIYTHPLEWYLSIDEKRDVIERLEGVLDISGWDIRKALKLFSKSNPPLYEWLESPIVYVDDKAFTAELKKFMPRFYSPVAALNHYLHMAKGNLREYLTRDVVKLKKYFYVLRPLLACMWIEQRDSMPPMEFERLLDAQELDEDLLSEIQKLLSEKRMGNELGEGKRIGIIDDFLRAKLEYYEGYVKGLHSNRTNKSNHDELDALLREVLSGSLRGGEANDNVLDFRK